MPKRVFCEPPVEATVKMPRRLVEALLARAGRRGFSAYVRGVLEAHVAGLDRAVASVPSPAVPVPVEPEAEVLADSVEDTPVVERTRAPLDQEEF